MRATARLPSPSRLCSPSRASTQPHSPSCRDVGFEVGQVNRQLAIALLPVLLGAGPAAAWLAAPTGVAVATVGAGGAALAVAVVAAVGVVGAIVAGPVIGIPGPFAHDDAAAAEPLATLPEPGTREGRTAPVESPPAPETPGASAADGASPTGVDGALGTTTGAVGGLVSGLTGGLTGLDADLGLGSGSTEVGLSVGDGLVEAGVGLGGESLLDMDLGVAGIDVDVRVGGQGGLLGLGLLGY